MSIEEDRKFCQGRGRMVYKSACKICDLRIICGMERMPNPKQGCKGMIIDVPELVALRGQEPPVPWENIAEILGFSPSSLHKAYSKWEKGNHVNNSEIRKG